MKILYYYIDFLAKSFDVKSRTSRKTFWIGLFKPKAQEAVPFLGILKKLTILSNTMLTVILYQDTQSFIEAVIIVYLYFYVMISPTFIVIDIINICKSKKN